MLTEINVKDEFKLPTLPGERQKVPASPTTHASAGISKQLRKPEELCGFIANRKALGKNESVGYKVFAKNPGCADKSDTNMRDPPFLSPSPKAGDWFGGVDITGLFYNYLKQ